MKRTKRFLFLLHRWLGVVMCLFFVLWFASGIIMMYVEYPELTEAERLDNLPPLAISGITVSAGQARAIAGLDGAVSSVELRMLGGRPAYFLGDAFGRQHTVFADDGGRLTEVSQALVMDSVRQSGFARDGAQARYDALIEDDQWSVSSSLNPHRPLHRVDVGDAAGTILYVSSQNGQVVRDTDRRERFWNWLGSTIHWIYPVQLRRHGALWADVIIYLSLVGLASVLTGAIIGLMRLRRRGQAKRSISPYRGVDKWHHIMGLLCLVFISTFMFSGLMSMTPWGLFQSEVSPAGQVERYVGGQLLALESFPDPESAVVPEGVKEVKWLQIAGEGYLVFTRTVDDRLVLLSGQAQPQRRPEALSERIRQAAPAMLPESSVVSLELLGQYDDYYYSRHNIYRPLPVYRVKFDDMESTWYHIDQNTGQPVSRHTDASRLQRWLFNGLHSLDFDFLLKRGLAWDITVILLSLLGLAFSLTSVIIGWRRLVRTLA